MQRDCVVAFLVSLAVLASGSAAADVVTTLDGASLIGAVKKITPTEVALDTTYAGVINVKLDQVKSMHTDTPITTRLLDDTTVTGTTVIGEDDVLRVTSEGQSTTVPLEKLVASWMPGTTPPPESGHRHWVYLVGADIAGKSGNSDESSTNVNIDMSLVSRLDELRFYGSVSRAEQESVETSDERIGGFSYAAYMYEPWGWYVRGELERDQFEDLDLRTTLAGGLSYRPINTEIRTLKFFTGVGYRHESFDDGTVESSPTLDIGLGHRWTWKPWLVMRNDFTYTPAVDDFGDYLFMHDSGLELPVGSTRWLLRLGVRNDYKSEPAPDRDELDTTYYARLSLRFE